jgi:pSer/pThr/pTyr-binding forkhead associated (FHA) protein
MDLYEVLWHPDEIEEFKKAPPPKKMSGEQLAMATGTRLGLDDEVRKAIAAAIKGKADASKAPAIEKKTFALVEVLPDRSLGKRFPLAEETMVVGREKGNITFPQDSLLSREHSVFSTLGGALYVEDLDSANGTFVRIRGQHDLRDDDIILLGRQMFRFHLLVKDKEPAEEKKKGKGKKKGKKKEKEKAKDEEGEPILAELVRMGKGGEEQERYALKRGENVMGRTQGDYTFPDDRYLSRIHARFKVHEGRSVLEDMKSTNGSYARIRERHLLDQDDTVLVGSQFLRVLAE